MTCGFLIQLVFCIKISLRHQSVTPFLSGASPPKKNRGSVPAPPPRRPLSKRLWNLASLSAWFEIAGSLITLLKLAAIGQSWFVIIGGHLKKMIGPWENWCQFIVTVLIRSLLSCLENPGDPCILDLGFILDASGSITFAWPGVRQFVANVVRQVNVSADGSHIGVIKFGADSNVEFGFSEGQDKDAVINRVLNLAGPKPFANTQLHLGIKDANEKLYNNATSSYRTDPSVRKVRPYYFLQQ